MLRFAFFKNNAFQKDHLMPKKTKYHNVIEVAAMLEITTQRVYILVKEGRLVPLRNEPPYLFTEKAIAKLEEIWPREEGAAGHQSKKSVAQEKRE